MKILITGGCGLLGKKLCYLLEENNYNVYFTFYNNPDYMKNCFHLDITSKDEVNNVLNKVNPDVLIHTAAYTNVDDCERNKDQAYDINVMGTKNLTIVANKLKVKLVYISTDYVFEGNKGYYREYDTTNPVDYYGKTKLMGEEVVKEFCENYIIARTSVIYGSNKSNFVTWLIESLERGERINIVSDQFVSPTLNIDLAEQLIFLIENDKTGIFHTAGGERINRYDFALDITDAFKLNKNLINPVSMADMNWIAQRPKDSSLNVSKISKIKKPYTVKKSLNFLRNELKK